MEKYTIFEKKQQKKNKSASCNVSFCDMFMYPPSIRFICVRNHVMKGHFLK